MEFKKYQHNALKTKPLYKDKIDQLVNGVMGLTGEAGEVIDIVKKFKYQGHDLDENKIIDELGDVLWYINLIADSINVDLADVAEYNILKLKKRYKKGYFRVEDSVNREE